MEQFYGGRPRHGPAAAPHLAAAPGTPRLGTGTPPRFAAEAAEPSAEERPRALVGVLGEAPPAGGRAVDAPPGHRPPRTAPGR